MVIKKDTYFCSVYLYKEQKAPCRDKATNTLPPKGRWQHMNNESKLIFELWLDANDDACSAKIGSVGFSYSFFSIIEISEKPLGISHLSINRQHNGAK